MQSHPAEQDQTKDRAKGLAQEIHGAASPGIAGGSLEQDLSFNGAHRPHSAFPPPFLHPNMMHLLQQTHLQQQHLFLQQQEQVYGRPFLSPQEHGNPELDPTRDQGLAVLQTSGSTENDGPQDDRVLFQGGGYQPPPLDMSTADSPQFRQAALNSMNQHPMFGLPNIHGPPGPGMAPMHAPYMTMNRMTPPPPYGFGLFPSHAMQGPPLFQAPFPHQSHQLPPQHQLHHQHQMFMNQQMLQQHHQNHQQLSPHQLHTSIHLSPQYSSGSLDMGHIPQSESQRSTGEAGDQTSDAIAHQQNQIKTIESQITQLLFQGDAASSNEGASRDSDAGSHTGKSSRPISAHCLTVQEIEEAQIKDLQSQLHKVSFADPATTRQPTESTVMERMSHSGSNSNTEPSAEIAPESAGQRLLNILDSVVQNPSFNSNTTPRVEATAERTPFSVKDIDFYSDKKYDPYRPPARVFTLITRDAKNLSQELMPNPEEETRKLALLERLTAIAKEVFGEAEVLPFGSSGNGLALANADMDVCVFLNTPEGSAEVSPVEFVERLGDRLEKDGEFENILQLKRARVPIVKLNHINGIACDIGYRNDLAIWNTRLLRAYTRIDERMRDMVTVIKTWAKRRKINNPYTGSLSSYAYVLLVIHVLQRCGVLPNLQAIVAGNGKIPYWDCQGYNRYFFEDIPNLSQYWKPTPESLKMSVGELLYEFFRYFANDFQYVTHVVSIRCGGLLTKEVKEWTREHMQSQRQQQEQQEQQQQEQQQQEQQPQEEQPPSTLDDTQADAQPSSDTKPTVRNRYLFCIEDPFELDHNIGRPVDRNSLYTIRGEFMRAGKLLSKNGEGAITRLCQERETLTAQEKSRNGGNDHGNGPSKDRQHHQHPRRDTAPGTSHDHQTTNGGQGGRRGSSGRLAAFPAGEERLRERDDSAQARTKGQGSFDGNAARGASSGTGSGDYGNRPRSGRRSFTKRPANANEPRHFS